jgi:hypothetical protein
MKQFLPALAVVAAFSVPASLAYSSTLIGSQVTDTSYYPNLSTPDTVPDTQTVNGAIEFPSGSETALNGTILIGTNIAVGASSIDFTFTENGTSAAAAFNGDVFDFSSSGPVITGVSLDPLSTFNASQIGLSFGPHEIEVDESGLHITTASQILIDIDLASSTTTPEPQAWALILTGLGLVGAGARRNRSMPKA